MKIYQCNIRPLVLPNDENSLIDIIQRSNKSLKALKDQFLYEEYMDEGILAV